jgi:hypothetical protein
MENFHAFGGGKLHEILARLVCKADQDEYNYSYFAVASKTPRFLT